jgi:hypothetical protein
MKARHRQQLRNLQSRIAELEAERITITLPAGAEGNEIFEALTLSESYPEWKTLAGDMCIILVTDDVRRGDVVNIKTRDGSASYIGELSFDDYYYTLPEIGDYEAISFHRTQADIIGRVVEIRRNGQPIRTPLPLRPIRPFVVATRFALLAWIIALQIYQSKTLRKSARYE